MRIVTNISAAILFSVIFSCNEKITINDFTGQLIVDTLSIEIDSLSPNKYFIYHAIKHSETNVLIGYNPALHSLDFFDLDRGEFIKHLRIDSQGPNAIDYVQDIFFHNEDSIFISSRLRLQLINSQAEVVDVYNLIDQELILNHGEPSSNFYFKLEYISSLNAVLFFNRPFNMQEDVNRERSLISMYDIKQRKYSVLPITFSEHYFNNKGTMGFLTYLNKDFVINETKLIYNYKYESQIYVYDLNSYKTLVYDAPSKNSSNVAKPLVNVDEEEAQHHALMNSHFFRVIANPKNNIYYRLHWGDNFEGESNFMNKQLYLMAFNEKFETLTEQLLPAHTYNLNIWFANEHGLYLSPTHPLNSNENENVLEFHIYKFE
jgi:hypothetical protein